jgi:two-component system, sensor histidine kinase PdtaS
MNGKTSKETSNADLRKKAEKRARNNAAWLNQNDPEELSPLALRSVLHELHIHQIELEMQNEELRRSHVELDAARSRYFDLFDLAPVGYFTIDDKGLVIEANLTGANLLGLTRTEVVGQPFSRFIAYDDQDVYYLHRKKLLETGEHQICELRMNKNSREPVQWVQVEASLATGHDGGQACLVICTDISKLKTTQAALDRKLDEERVLLSETHHRIKNNIASIISLLNMQARENLHPEALSCLHETIGRLKLMAELYEKMLLKNRKKELDLGSYLGDIAASIIKLFASDTEIAVSTRFDALMLDSDTVFSIGILFNELLTNAMKYAFPARKTGTIQLSSTFREGKLTLIIHDDGIGLPADFKPATDGGFGLRLVYLLAEQLGGIFTMETAEGTLCTLVVPL